MKNTTIRMICICLAALTIAGSSVAIIIGVKQKDQSNPPDNTEPITTDTQTEPDDTYPIEPPVSTDKPSTPAEPDEIPADMDVENDPRPQTPSVVDSSVESGVKDE